MMMMVKVVMAMMVGSSECGSSSRCEHHSKKGEGDLPHASFISRSLLTGNTTFDVCAYSCTGTLIPRSASAKRAGSFRFCMARSTTTWTVSPSASSAGAPSGVGRNSR